VALDAPQTLLSTPLASRVLVDPPQHGPTYRYTERARGGVACRMIDLKSIDKMENY